MRKIERERNREAQTLPEEQKEVATNETQVDRQIYTDRKIDRNQRGPDPARGTEGSGY